MKRNIKEHGITLIALVITIIILLILAGITISSLTNSGLFDKVKEAKEKWKNAQEENEILDKYYKETQKYLGNGNDDLNAQVSLDSDLREILKQANIEITLNDILNAPDVINNAALIPRVTSSDVTQTSTSPITYTISNNRGIIRVSSQLGSNFEAWNAIDNSNSTDTVSTKGVPDDYYCEFEFPEKVYAFCFKYRFSNGASANSTRTFDIQGYNEEKENIQGEDPWETLATENWSGNYNSDQSMDTPHEVSLNYSKSYKRYRAYVTSVGGQNSYSGFSDFQLCGKK